VLLRRVAGAVVVAELVVEAFVAEVALLLGDPFLQPARDPNLMSAFS
jgi:hypothetical protein